MTLLHIFQPTASKRGRFACIETAPRRDCGRTSVTKFVRIDATPVRGRPAKRESSPLSLIDANQETQVRVHRDQAAVKVTATSKNKRTAPRRDCGRTSVTKFARIEATSRRGILAKRRMQSPFAHRTDPKDSSSSPQGSNSCGHDDRQPPRTTGPTTEPVAPKTLNPNL